MIASRRPVPVALLLLLALLAAPVLRAQGYGGLRGEVLDDDGERLSFATVHVESADGILRTGTVSDEDGIYVLPRLPVGAYRLRAEWIGMRTEEREAEVRDGAWTTLSLTITPVRIPWCPYPVPVPRLVDDAGGEGTATFRRDEVRRGRP
jgi:hypothetical protein